jgi:hypothetical protein
VNVGLLLGLAKAMLALDLDVIKTVLEREAHDLGALCLGRAIRHKGKLDPEFLEPIERFVRPRKHAQLGLMDLLEPVADRAAQLGRWRGKPGGGGQLA